MGQGFTNASQTRLEASSGNIHSKKTKFQVCYCSFLCWLTPHYQPFGNLVSITSLNHKNQIWINTKEKGKY